MPGYFIFLEILDPEINAFFSMVSEIMVGEKPKRAPHLTVRGPYEGKLPESILEECKEAMKYDVLKIGPVGRFSNKDEEIVYFMVDSPHLRKIWWKPSYPMKKHGFNPHLSIYRGINRRFADSLVSLLEKEEIILLCAEHRLVSHLVKQIELFPENIPVARHFKRLVDSSRVSPKFLSRLKRIVNESL
ncbi:MAG: hypothetical protein GXO96_04055 [Nitrospirae bacterium]|nr:hypothetical protein [Candidatus Manganitrophaceae bacterium]